MPFIRITFNRNILYLSLSLNIPYTVFQPTYNPSGIGDKLAGGPAQIESERSPQSLPQQLRILSLQFRRHTENRDLEQGLSICQQSAQYDGRQETSIFESLAELIISSLI